IKDLKPLKESDGRKIAIVVGVPAGMAASFFLAREGAQVTLFEKRNKLGGIVRYVIPTFRIAEDCIEKDSQLLEKMGVNIQTGTIAPPADELFESGYTQIIYAIGAWAEGTLSLKEGKALNVIRFLERVKEGTVGDIGKNVIVIGGGNTAMDAARVAKRQKGVEHAMLVYRRTARFMPADEEELKLAMQDGVEFKELLSPVALKDGKLICEKMKLGQPDSSGRQRPVKTGEMLELPCDTLIAAIGEKVDTEVLTENAIGYNESGTVRVNDDLETGRQGIYAIGDCRRGPATVVECIADARKVADRILGKDEAAAGPETCICEAQCYARQGILEDYNQAEKENDRCLNCGKICECCVQVCPNRANIAIRIPGMQRPQILHIDRMCNECGNCLVFCPYNSRPYKEKWTLFHTEHEFDGSENDGFIPLEKGYKVRISGEVKQVESLDALPEKIGLFIRTIEKDYAYLIG
ncbi:MAG: FAD-dependent oxidoreductase, partial [Lachnospiraceae bacterium]|nr:FAD-dependent oxidoreductase [Lachnospiraceae bacterium]